MGGVKKRKSDILREIEDVMIEHPEWGSDIISIVSDVVYVPNWFDKEDMEDCFKLEFPNGYNDMRRLIRWLREGFNISGEVSDALGEIFLSCPSPFEDEDMK